MSFAHPWALWLSPLIAGPVVLHLISRFWVKKRPFPWIRLLNMGATRARGLKRLEEFVLIALRTLFVACLVFAAAGPNTGGLKGLEVAVDVSASTSAYRSRINIPGARFFDFTWRDQWPEVPSGLANPDLVKGKRCFVISDFQASNWKAFADTGLIPVVMPRGNTGNVALMEVVAQSPRPGPKLRLRVRLHNYCDKTQTRSLAIRDNNKSLFNATVQIRPHEDTVLSPEIRLERGTLGLVASIGPPDQMGFDDTFRLAVVRPGAVDIDLMVDNPFVRAGLFPTGLSWSLRQRSGAQTVVASGPPVPGRKGIAFVRDSVDALAWGIAFDSFEGAKLRGLNASVKKGVFFKQGRGLLWDENSRALAVQWGDWVLCGFDPDPLNTDLVFKAEFPILLNQWIDLLSSVPTCITGTTGQRVELEPGQAYITGPGGFKRPAGPFVPMRPGFYKQTKGDSLISLVAVNTPRQESDPKSLSQQQLQTAFGKRPISLSELESRINSRLELTPWLLLLALMAMLAEAGLIRWRT